MVFVGHPEEAVIAAKQHIRQLKPGKDGRCGAMSLCLACAEIMLENKDLRLRVQLSPVITDE